MLLFITLATMHVVSSMKLRGLVKRPELNGKTIIGSFGYPIEIDVESAGVRVPVCVLNDDGDLDAPIYVDYDKIDFASSEIFNEIGAALRKAARDEMYGMAYDEYQRARDKSLTDDEKLQMARNHSDPMTALAILDAMTLEQLDDKQRLVRHLGTVMHDGAGGGERGKEFLVGVLMSFSSDDGKRAIVAHSFDGIGDFRAYIAQYDS